MGISKSRRFERFRHTRAALKEPLFFVLCAASFITATSAAASAQSEIPELNAGDLRMALTLFMRLVEGIFGSLVMVGAGFMAMLTAAVGGYRMSVRMLILAVGALILRSVAALFVGAS